MNEIIESEDGSIIYELIPDYKDVREEILSKVGLDLTAIGKALRVVESYKNNVIVIPKTAQDELRLMQTEAIQSDVELGAILFWIMFKRYISNSCYIVSVLDTIIPCENTAVNPKKAFNPDYKSIVHAIGEVVSGEYQGFSILHTHPSDSFLSCQDIITKTYADISDTLDLYYIWKKYLTFTDITKTDIHDVYRIYTYLPDIVVMGGVSHECVMFNSYSYTEGKTLVLTYYDVEHCYLGKWLSLYSYVFERKYEEPYYDLFNYYYKNCYPAFKFTGFIVLEQKRINDKVFYTITRL